MLSITLQNIVDSVGECELKGSEYKGVIKNVRPADSADNESVIWVRNSLENIYSVLKFTLAPVIICDKNLNIDDELIKSKCFIVVDDPKIAFVRLINKCFKKTPKWQVHPTACIHPEAEIHPNTYIGPYCVIGRAKIGEGSILHGHCFVYDDSEIGRNVVMHAHAVVGSDGFGFVWNEDKEIEKFIHVGKTIIEDDVELYPFSNVDRGTLGETRVGRSSKLDHYVHCGHNCKIGENSIITAGTVTCGGSEVGSNSWLGVNSIIKEKRKVGDDATVGFGAIVNKNVPDGEIWTGVPARNIKQHEELQSQFKKMLKSE
ncbi:hypothetical protein ACWJJH_12760 [Endozoicomonadaceae bacterium StTr2]